MTGGAGGRREIRGMGTSTGPGDGRRRQGEDALPPDAYLAGGGCSACPARLLCRAMCRSLWLIIARCAFA